MGVSTHPRSWASPLSPLSPYRQASPPCNHSLPCNSSGLNVAASDYRQILTSWLLKKSPLSVDAPILAAWNLSSPHAFDPERVFFLPPFPPLLPQCPQPEMAEDYRDQQAGKLLTWALAKFVGGPCTLGVVWIGLGIIATHQKWSCQDAKS